MAATPEAPTTLGTTMRPAPLLAVEVLLGVLPDLEDDPDGFEVVVDEVVVDDPLGPGVEDPPGAVVPLICA